MKHEECKRTDVKVKSSELNSSPDPLSTLLSGHRQGQQISCGRGAAQLLPLPNADHKCLQTYFMGNIDKQTAQHCRLNTGTEKEVVTALQTLFDQHC
ncbi:hypothetical protein CEXT_146271 [Caerostris extrusa]|uniref:Uncharacterized protein n=1 Tax=Caerostris extrusa TaxID=172846 RepID=A0AAV4SNG6_CAEEX|nr:hypothetical protein CEXT_146271 [Caerostris extrusa]